MPSIIIEHAGVRRGLVLDERLLIGRRAISGLTVEDSDVSRLHAWIGRAATDTYFVVDSFSRTGTWVNGHRITARQELHDGDQIRVGPAAITFRRDSRLPRNVDLVSSDVSGTLGESGGILFDCDCGAPIWVRSSLSGRSGNCLHCGKVIRVPLLRPIPPRDEAEEQPAATDNLAPEPLDDLELEPIADTAPSAESEICSICQTEVGPDDEIHTCSECQLQFHAECWQANRGCSAYGCSQVNALDRPAGQQATDAAHGDEEDQELATAGSEREFLFLGLSVLGVLLGSLTFGVSSLAAALAALVYALRNRGHGRMAVSILSVTLGLIGFVVGVAISRFWWLGRPLPGMGG